MSAALKVSAKKVNVKASAKRARKPAAVVVPAAEPVGNYNTKTKTFMSSTPKAAEVKKPVRVTKKRVIYDLLTSGKFRAEDLGGIMGITTVAARSLIGDLRRDGTEVKSSFENKLWFYTIETK